jgi:hypothetical protein
MGLPSLVPPSLNGQVYSLNQIVTFVNQECQFSFYYNALGPVNQANVGQEEIDIADHWLNVTRPLLRAVLSIGTSLKELRTWCMTWPNVATSIVSTGNQLGTRTGDPLPPQVALVLTKRTKLRGKSGRGRMFLCGMSEDDSTLAVPSAALGVAAKALADHLVLPFVGAGSGTSFVPVVVSLIGYKKVSQTAPPNPQPVPPPIQFIPGMAIDSILPETIWNTQRSRGIGHGR